MHSLADSLIGNVNHYWYSTCPRGRALERNHDKRPAFDLVYTSKFRIGPPQIYSTCAYMFLGQLAAADSCEKAESPKCREFSKAGAIKSRTSKVSTFIVARFIISL